MNNSCKTGMCDWNIYLFVGLTTVIIPVRDFKFNYYFLNYFNCIIT